PTQLDRALASLVDLAQLALAGEDFSAGGKVWPFDVLEQAGCSDFGVVDHGDEGVDYLGEVMGRDVGRHAHSDAARSIKQQLGNRCRQDHRLLKSSIIVRAVRDGLAVQVAEQL